MGLCLYTIVVVLVVLVISTATVLGEATWAQQCMGACGSIATTLDMTTLTPVSVPKGGLRNAIQSRAGALKNFKFVLATNYGVDTLTSQIMMDGMSNVIIDGTSGLAMNPQPTFERFGFKITNSKNVLIVGVTFKNISKLNDDDFKQGLTSDWWSRCHNAFDICEQKCIGKTPANDWKPKKCKDDFDWSKSKCPNGCKVIAEDMKRECDDGVIQGLDDARKLTCDHLNEQKALEVRTTSGLWVHRCSFLSTGETIQIYDPIDTTTSPNYAITWSYFNNVQDGIILYAGGTGSGTRPYASYTLHHNYYLNVNRRTPMVNHDYAFVHTFNNYRDEISAVGRLLPEWRIELKHGYALIEGEYWPTSAVRPNTYPIKCLTDGNLNSLMAMSAWMLTSDTKLITQYSHCINATQVKRPCYSYQFSIQGLGLPSSQLTEWSNLNSRSFCTGEIYQFYVKTTVNWVQCVQSFAGAKVFSPTSTCWPVNN